MTDDNDSPLKESDEMKINCKIICEKLRKSFKDYIINIVKDVVEKGNKK
jgi:hypothetical protein